MTFYALACRRVFLTLLATGVGLIAGCGVTPEQGDKTPYRLTLNDFDAHAGNTQRFVVPAGARKVPMPDIDALKGDGLYYFDNDLKAHFFLADLISENGLYPIKELFPKGAPHGFTWGSGAAAVLRNGIALDPQSAQSASIAPDGHIILHFPGQEAMELHITLDAYDVSGLLIRDFLRNRGNLPSKAAFFMKEERFPKGSLAYSAEMWTTRDEVLVPTRKAFTGANSFETLSSNFSKKVPYCIRYVNTPDVQPMGMKFDKKLSVKRIRQNGRWVQAPLSGTVDLYRVKPNTLFCHATQNTPSAKAAYSLSWINGTRVLRFTFPSSIRESDVGLMPIHRGAMQLGFAELITKNHRSETKSVVPARIWLKNQHVKDAQYRFNSIAADAIDTAIRAASRRHQDWDSYYREQAAQSSASNTAKK